MATSELIECVAHIRDFSWSGGTTYVSNVSHTSVIFHGQAGLRETPVAPRHLHPQGDCWLPQESAFARERFRERALSRKALSLSLHSVNVTVYSSTASALRLWWLQRAICLENIPSAPVFASSSEKRCVPYQTTPQTRPGKSMTAIRLLSVT